MKRLILIACLISLNSFGQGELNYGSVGFSTGLHYSRQLHIEFSRSFTEGDISYRSFARSRFSRFSAYGSIFYQSKRFYWSESWSFQFILKSGFYSTLHTVRISDLSARTNGQIIRYANIDFPEVTQISKAFNIAPQVKVGITRKMGTMSYLNVSLGYAYDYALTSELEWLEPFPNNEWQTINFPDKPGERINQDVFFTMNPYWHVGEKLQLGANLSVPLPLFNLLEPNQIFIPGKHNNFMIRNYFIGIQVALRLDTSYAGCGSCP